MPTQTALIGLGSSLSWLGCPPASILGKAAASLARLGAVRLSPLYDSPAWPDPAGPPYVNAVAALETQLSPEALLAACQAIEAAFGRRRDPANRNAARTLDLDLVAYGDLVRATEALTLPHPRASVRDFVLLPLRDVAPDWQDPSSGQPVQALIDALPQVTATRRRAL